MRASEFVTEKKKRRKPRWAAYGPGPFGGYGFVTGYGGDSSVGEASYEGNIGAMEVFKFMQKATDFEKKLLQKLITEKNYSRAWALVQGVTGTKLVGKEFEGVEEGWKERVRDKVDSFKDTKAVTKPINPRMKHLDQRKEKHKEFMVAMK